MSLFTLGSCLLVTRLRYPSRAMGGCGRDWEGQGIAPSWRLWVIFSSYLLLLTLFCRHFRPELWHFESLFPQDLMNLGWSLILPISLWDAAALRDPRFDPATISSLCRRWTAGDLWFAATGTPWSGFRSASSAGKKIAQKSRVTRSTLLFTTTMAGSWLRQL